jgi:hypothetical protein
MQTELLAFDKVLDEMANRKIALDLEMGLLRIIRGCRGYLLR